MLIKKVGHLNLANSFFRLLMYLWHEHWSQSIWKNITWKIPIISNGMDATTQISQQSLIRLTYNTSESKEKR